MLPVTAWAECRVAAGKGNLTSPRHTAGDRYQVLFCHANFNKSLRKRLSEFTHLGTIGQVGTQRYDPFVAKVPLGLLTRPLLPMFALEIIALFLVTYFPALSLWLPELVLGKAG